MKHKKAMITAGIFLHDNDDFQPEIVSQPDGDVVLYFESNHFLPVYISVERLQEVNRVISDFLAKEKEVWTAEDYQRNIG